MTPRWNRPLPGSVSPAVKCKPEQVTAFVDEALAPSVRDEIAAHVEACAVCGEQAEIERSLRSRLRGLPPIAPPVGLEARVRARLGRRHRLSRALIPLAASVVLAILWGRGAPFVVAWELAQDHEQCRSVRILDREAPEIPSLPGETAGLSLVAASLCELRGRSLVVHMQYASGDRRVSLFLVRGAVHLGGAYETRVHGQLVRLVPADGRVAGLVGERSADLDAVQRAVRIRTVSGASLVRTASR